MRTLNRTFGCSDLELRDRRRQQFAGDQFDRRDADLPAHESAQLLDLRLDRLELRNRLARIGEKELAGRRKPDAARQTFEQRRAQIRLEVEDLAVQSRRCDIERVRRFADRAVPGHRIHVGQ